MHKQRSLQQVDCHELHRSEVLTLLRLILVHTYMVAHFGQAHWWMPAVVHVLSLLGPSSDSAMISVQMSLRGLQTGVILLGYQS